MSVENLAVAAVFEEIADRPAIQGLGRDAKQMLELDVQTPERVLRAARDGRIRALSGFGEKTERLLEAAVAAHLSKEQRMKLATAAQYADALAHYLEHLPEVDRVVAAGSFRRMHETVGNLDLVVAARRVNAAMEHFVAYPDVQEVVSRGNTRTSVRLRGGLQIDLRAVAAESFGAALVYFTGSKAHNIALRRIAQERGLKINEYGVFKGVARIAGDTEASVYRAVGLPEILPELREDRGEIEAARAGRCRNSSRTRTSGAICTSTPKPPTDTTRSRTRSPRRERCAANLCVCSTAPSLLRPSQRAATLNMHTPGRHLLMHFDLAQGTPPSLWAQMRASTRLDRDRPTQRARGSALSRIYEACWAPPWRLH
jgi:DNA polymerase/3'-5' exonuclease PolX